MTNSQGQATAGSKDRGPDSNGENGGKGNGGSVCGGILPCQDIAALVDAGRIKLASSADEGQIQPASLDLRLGKVAYRVRASFLPGPKATVRSKLDEFALHRVDLSEGAVLETGCVYVVPLLEALELPADLSAAANPKSSTGRLDVFTRVIADGVAAFDQVPKGYSGPLYAEICPQTFPVLVRQGSKLTQLRFRRGNSQESDAALMALHAAAPLVSGEQADIADGIALSVDLSTGLNGKTRAPASPALIGYRAKRNTAVVDMDKPGAHAIDDFWEPLTLRAGEQRLILDPDQFYILASKEAIAIPPTHAAEMLPFNPLVGEFRVHYAGFMDPGFGYGPAAGSSDGTATPGKPNGARVVLEVRSHKVPFILEHGQIIGRLIYERMTSLPDRLYGADLKSNYQGQGLKLSKHFA